MTELHIRLTFLEPFRLTDWEFPEARNNKNHPWTRGQTFARWHKEKNTDKGRPYIPGTLLRSALIKAVEEELARGNSEWKCCPGAFFSESERGKQPQHLRHRATLTWDTTNSPTPCIDAQKTCPLCMILGRRFDEADIKKQEKRTTKNDKFSIHFGNLNLPDDRNRLFGSLKELGVERTLNRVDQETGKAHDFFEVWEIDRIKDFRGTITLDDNLPNAAKAKELLCRAAGFVDTLCGALCTVRIKEDGVTTPTTADQPAGAEDVTKATDAAVALFSRIPTDKHKDRLRRLADGLRALREMDPAGFSLPEGHPVEAGKPEHYIWDKIELTNGETLRKHLETYAAGFQHNRPAWICFCNTLGQLVFQESKKHEPPRAPGRHLGDAVCSKNPGVPSSYSEKSLTPGAFTHEWIITGRLRAETPLAIGADGREDDQTSLKVLIDRKNGHFRLPRSALRGLLRRDLGAITGQGCRAELGLERPCSCPVCLIMRAVTIREAVSESEINILPDIRHRIRRAARTGTVADGALFDSETCPQGMEFPFVLRYRGGNSLSKYLGSVLSWWQEGLLFAGGDSGTGKGRLELDRKSLKIFRWDLSTPANREEYADHCGLRSKIELDPNGLPPSCRRGSAEFLESSTKYPWERVSWALTFEGPVLSNDPIDALIRREQNEKDQADAVFYRKTVIGSGKVFALRGEGLRGVARQALARADGEELLTQDHEDCDCPLCKVFGNEHNEGLVRFEDMTAIDPVTKRIHHISTDRFDSSVVGKYDGRPLVGSPDRPLVFSGCFWLRRNAGGNEKMGLAKALADIRDGLYPMGSRGGTGYGWVRSLTICEPVWLVKLLASHAGPATDTKRRETAAEALSAKPHFTPKPEALYCPYYFVVPGPGYPERTSRPVSHETLHKGLLTGKISCTLTVDTPLILPDADKMTRAENGHKTYPAFRLNETLMIPAAQIRAAVSRIFETLTNSCFRVMDQKRYLSWRMKPEDDFLPGRVSNNCTKIVEMAEFRLPLYDVFTATKSIAGSKKVSDCCKNSDPAIQEKIDRTLRVNRVIARVAELNRKFLSGKSDSERRAILDGEKLSTFRPILPNRGNPNDIIARLNDHGPGSGYIKLTGPNNANVRKTKADDFGYDETWIEPLNFRLTGPPECRKSLKKIYPRPGLVCIKDGKQYKVSKRCERVFHGTNVGGADLHRKIRDQYRDMLEEYRKNANSIAAPFRSHFRSTELKDDDLVYFKKDSNNRVTAVIPVRLSQDRRHHSAWQASAEGAAALRPCLP